MFVWKKTQYSLFIDVLTSALLLTKLLMFLPRNIPWQKHVQSLILPLTKF